jgi:hypothetical protein
MYADDGFGLRSRRGKPKCAAKCQIGVIDMIIENPEQPAIARNYAAIAA